MQGCRPRENKNHCYSIGMYFLPKVCVFMWGGWMLHIGGGKICPPQSILSISVVTKVYSGMLNSLKLTHHLVEEANLDSRHTDHCIPVWLYCILSSVSWPVMVVIVSAVVPEVLWMLVSTMLFTFQAVYDGDQKLNASVVKVKDEELAGRRVIVKYLMDQEIVGIIVLVHRKTEKVLELFTITLFYCVSVAP